MTVEPTTHEIVSDGLDTHHGEYWYKCVKCGAKDWIASYGTKEQLEFYRNPCPGGKE